MEFGPHFMLACLEGAVTAAVIALTAAGLSHVLKHAKALVRAQHNDKIVAAVGMVARDTAVNLKLKSIDCGHSVPPPTAAQLQLCLSICPHIEYLRLHTHKDGYPFDKNSNLEKEHEVHPRLSVR